MKSHNKNLDILRGVAALSVVLYHLNLLASVFDSKYSIAVIQYIFPGHLSVLVFFILSGYVIAYNTKPLNNANKIVTYTKKRIVRIYPIYLFALLLTVLIASGKYNWYQILMNCLFLSVPLDNVLKENGPLWSLEYEMFFYFLFIFISYFKLNLKNIIIILCLLVVSLFFIDQKMLVHPLIISGAIGLLFWVTGAYFGGMSSTKTLSANGSRVAAVFLIMFFLQKFNPYEPIMKALHFKLLECASCSEFQQTITFFDLYFYPLSIILILALSNTNKKYFNALYYFLIATSFAVMVTIPFAYGWHRMIEKQYIVPAVILVVSLVFWMLNFDFSTHISSKIGAIAPLSNISYALYIVHSPLIYCFSLVQATSPIFFIFKLTAYFGLLLFLSYLLEMKMQPLVKRTFFK
jgi:peptidoglycan/LPS O-acetylase OafA/YrhL